MDIRKRVIRVVVTVFITLSFVVLDISPYTPVAVQAATVSQPSITIKKIPEEIVAGNSYQLTAKTKGINKATLTWTSSDTTVAMIDKKSGMLYALSAGKTKITVKDDKSGVKKVITLNITNTASNKYTAPKNSDRAVFLSGLDLSKMDGTYYKTEKEEYIETSRFILFLDDGVEVPTDAVNLINHIMDMIEAETGYSFYTKRFSGSNEFNMDDEIEKYFETGNELKLVNKKHDKISIVVAHKDTVSCAIGSHGVLISPEDIKLLDGYEDVLIHELLHVIDMRNGCWEGTTLGEGFTTYYTTLITKEDSVMNGYYDGFIILQGFNNKLAEATMEDFFIELTGGWSSYQLGFRMMNFIMETYGAEAYREMHAKLSEKYDNPTMKEVAAILKSELSKDFFKAFVRWYQKNYEKFGDTDMSSVGDWSITGEYLTKYYGDAAEVTIPDTVTTILSEAFRDNKTMVSVQIPDSVTEIGSSAFYDCDSLKEIVIPDSITKIGYCAFEQCDSLSKVILPKEITCIDIRTFSDCSSLKEITIPEGVSEIMANGFSNCISLTSVKLPDTLKNIGDIAFLDCKKLKSITIPASVKSIGENAFLGCHASLTIRGKRGSYAETYAKKNKIKFSAIK